MPDHQTLELRSAILAEKRRVHVYAPPAGLAGSRPLPTLYLLDGGTAEDFPHVATTIDTLLRDGSIAPLRLVGIENTQRRRDVTPATSVATDREIAPQVGGSAAFRAFLREELIPTIESRFGAAPRRALLGESLAGLFVVETVLVEPKLFDDFIAISPSLWWNDREYVRSAHERARNQDFADRRVYLTAANEEGIAEETAELAAALREATGHTLILHHVPRPDLEHGTIFRAVEAEVYRTLFTPGP